MDCSPPGSSVQEILQARILEWVAMSTFPVVICGCESWTMKKAELWRIDAFELWCWRRLLRVPWIARRSNQSILMEINPECSLEGLMLKLKLQYFGHLMGRTDSLERVWKDHGKNWLFPYTTLFRSTVKKAELWRIDAFELWYCRRLLRVPWRARRSNQSILKEISPGCSLERLMLKLKLQYFDHLMWRADSESW